MKIWQVILKSWTISTAFCLTSMIWHLWKLLHMAQHSLLGATIHNTLICLNKICFGLWWSHYLHWIFSALQISAMQQRQYHCIQIIFLDDLETWNSQIYFSYEQSTYFWFIWMNQGGCHVLVFQNFWHQRK